jgi:hypothetical protein
MPIYIRRATTLDLRNIELKTLDVPYIYLCIRGEEKNECLSVRVGVRVGVGGCSDTFLKRDSRPQGAYRIDMGCPRYSTFGPTYLLSPAWTSCQVSRHARLPALRPLVPLRLMFPSRKVLPSIYANLIQLVYGGRVRFVLLVSVGISMRSRCTCNPYSRVTRLAG